MSVPKNLLDCSVCLGLVCEPVSLSCGHTFCRTCLVKTLQQTAKRCPCCRAVCHTRAEDQPQNVMIAQVVKALFPEQLERRMRETEAEKTKFVLRLPAFFFNRPMFPGETLALHFFEPRYKLMMRRIIDTTRRFAYVPKYSSFVANKGDTAVVAEVVEAEFLSDGRVNVKIKLVGRHTVQDHYVEEGTQGLHYCELEPYEDDALEAADVGELEELHESARALCHGFLGPFKSQLVQSHGEMPSGALALSMWMASFLPFYFPEKYRLLVSRCTRGRLRACLKCVESMEKMAKGLRRGDERAAEELQPQGATESTSTTSNVAEAEPGALAPGPTAEASVSVSVRAEGLRG